MDYAGTNLTGLLGRPNKITLTEGSTVCGLRGFADVRGRRCFIVFIPTWWVVWCLYTSHKEMLIKYQAMSLHLSHWPGSSFAQWDGQTVLCDLEGPFSHECSIVWSLFKAAVTTAGKWPTELPTLIMKKESCQDLGAWALFFPSSWAAHICLLAFLLRPPLVQCVLLNLCFSDRFSSRYAQRRFYLSISNVAALLWSFSYVVI